MQKHRDYACPIANRSRILVGRAVAGAWDCHVAKYFPSPFANIERLQCPHWQLRAHCTVEAPVISTGNRLISRSMLKLSKYSSPPPFVRLTERVIAPAKTDHRAVSIDPCRFKLGS